MNPLTDIAIGAAGKVIEAVGNAADSLFTSDDERNKAEIEMRRIDGDLEKAYLADVDSARKHDAAVQESQNASYLAKNVAYWLDIFIVTATFVMAYMLLFREIPTTNKELFFTAFGSLVTLCMTVVNFHRGSTFRSQQKDTTISRLAANK